VTVPKRSLEDIVGQAVAGNGEGVATTEPDSTDGGGVTAADPQSSEVQEFRSPVVRKSRTSAPPQNGSTGPRYLRLARKDVRLREDQMETLVTAARRLSRDRTDKTERITENTLIRIAVDLLIPRLGELQGDSEEALLESLR
jgi:hypothetical protein